MTINTSPAEDAVLDLAENIVRAAGKYLTGRQRNVARMVMRGMTQQEMARKLGVHQSSIHKTIHGNIDYRLKKRYGGIATKVAKLYSKDPVIAGKRQALATMFGSEADDEAMTRSVQELSTHVRKVAELIGLSGPGGPFGRVSRVKSAAWKGTSRVDPYISKSKKHDGNRYWHTLNLSKIVADGYQSILFRHQVGEGWNEIRLSMEEAYAKGRMRGNGTHADFHFVYSIKGLMLNGWFLEKEVSRSPSHEDFSTVSDHDFRGRDFRIKALQEIENAFGEINQTLWNSMGGKIGSIENALKRWKGNVTPQKRHARVLRRLLDKARSSSPGDKSDHSVAQSEGRREKISISKQQAIHIAELLEKSGNRDEAFEIYKQIVRLK